MATRLRMRQPERAPERRDGEVSPAAVQKQQGLQQRDDLKHTREAGVIDWGSGRKPECRYEAYWRGMSLGLFPSLDDARSYLRGMDGPERAGGQSPGRARRTA